MTAAPDNGPLAQVLADLHNREIATIGAEVVDFVGRARRIIESPVSAADDLTDAGLGFLVQLLAPLDSCLEQVAGDTESLGVKADEWAGIAEDLHDTVRRLDITARTEWTGPAADAFEVTVARFTSTAADAAQACAVVSTLLRTSADLMAGARGLIVDIIDRVVQFMIVTEAAASTSAGFTAGASEAAALLTILGQVGEEWSRRSRSWIGWATCSSGSGSRCATSASCSGRSPHCCDNWLPCGAR